MIYIIFGIVIIAAVVTKYVVPIILSTTKIPHHLVPIINFILNISVLLLTFFVLYFSLKVLGVINLTEEIKLVGEKKSRISKDEYPLIKKEEERERIEQERLRELEAEKERQRVELEKQRRIAEEKERERIEQERLRELEAEKERRVELEKQRRLAEKKERERIEQEGLRELEAEKERQRVELEKQRRTAEEKERERIEREHLRELEEEKKSPCEKIKDSLDKRLLNNAIKNASNDVMTILQNRQGIRCYIIPSGIKRGCIEYQIQKEGSSELCFYKDCTER